MKNKFSLLVLSALVGAFSFTSCKKDKPAELIQGTFKGSFEGKYFGVDSLTSSGYSVNVSMINDNKIKVEGHNFDTFELLVASNGLNVEPINQSDPYLSDFIYIGDEMRLKFTFNKGLNEAEFIGTK